MGGWQRRRLCSSCGICCCHCTSPVWCSNKPYSSIFFLLKASVGQIIHLLSGLLRWFFHPWKSGTLFPGTTWMKSPIMLTVPSNVIRKHPVLCWKKQHERNVNVLLLFGNEGQAATGWWKCCAVLWVTSFLFPTVTRSRDQILVIHTSLSQSRYSWDTPNQHSYIFYP